MIPWHRCDRPLYLSIYIEVWLSKEGHFRLNSTEELLSEYLNKEKQRWSVQLGREDLVDSYLRVLAVACAIDSFNLTDRHGDDYLDEDCRKLIHISMSKAPVRGRRTCSGSCIHGWIP